MIRVGVVGVGRMGRHHARIYAERPEANLVGIHDADADRAREVAANTGTRARDLDGMLADVDAVSVAVPTAHHAAMAERALEADVDVLVEKPITNDPATARELVDLADDRDVLLGVGHIERFNPAVQVLPDVLADAEVLAVDARRLGPPLDRDVGDSVVLDLMIHDVDVVSSLVDGEVTEVTAARADGAPYVNAALSFDDGTVGTLTASRTTQRKVRRLAVTTSEFRVDVDYLTQSVEIYRRSLPEYVERDGDVRYRNETVVERPTVRNGEPLKAELESFIAAAAGEEQFPVTGEDGLRALELAHTVDRKASRVRREVRPR